MVIKNLVMEAGSKRRVKCKNVAQVEHTEIDDCLAEVDNANRRIKGDSFETEFGKSEGRTGGRKTVPFILSMFHLRDYLNIHIYPASRINTENFYLFI